MVEAQYIFIVNIPLDLIFISLASLSPQKPPNHFKLPSVYPSFNMTFLVTTFPFMLLSFSWNYVAELFMERYTHVSMLVVFLR
nr:hypothetical protein Itr_chr01CG18280 [Ipomoea trifida]